MLRPRWSCSEWSTEAGCRCCKYWLLCPLKEPYCVSIVVRISDGARRMQSPHSCIFATYQPKPGEKVDNLLSKHIVNPSRGLHQFRGDAGDASFPFRPTGESAQRMLTGFQRLLNAPLLSRLPLTHKKVRFFNLLRSHLRGDVVQILRGIDARGNRNAEP
jgi:hypothetical protein